MNNEQWLGIELLGPPPAGERWFPAGRWECGNGHIEFGGVNTADSVTTGCAMCEKPMAMVHAAWVQGIR